MRKPIYSIEQIADFLVNGYWPSQFPGHPQSEQPHHFATSVVTFNIDQLATDGQFLAKTALQAWADVCNLTFVQTAGAALINFQEDLPAGANSSFTAVSGITTSTTINVSKIGNPDIAFGGSAFQGYLHEIGHALGLGHAGPYAGLSSYSADTDQSGNNIYLNDTQLYSVMSYFGAGEYNGSNRQDSSPMLGDIAAARLLYGEAQNTRTSNTVYGFNSNAGDNFNFGSYSNSYSNYFTGPPALTIYDNGGFDTIDCSGYSNAQKIDLTPGAFSSIGGMINNIALASNCVIEAAIGGSGNDIMEANIASNILDGQAGDDILSGGEGNDTLIGGPHSVGGWNTLSGDGGSDTVSYAAETGNVYADLSLAQAVGYVDNGSGFVFSDLITGVENLTGGSGSDQLTGSGLDNVLNGGAGDDHLNGGAGNDTLIGGGHTVGGYDVLFGEAGIDTVDFSASTAKVTAIMGNGTGAGGAYIDSGSGNVFDSLLFTAENLTGGSNADTFVGNTADNVLTGGDGNDFMLGQSGNDTLFGGLGNDSLYGDDGLDFFGFDQGLDIATGGLGADVFSWTSRTQGADIISDFSHAEGDKIYLDHTAFGVPLLFTLTQGVNFFVGAGATATQATATLAFDTTTNILWYDIDGTGASGREAINFLSNGGGGITASDIVFV